MNGYKPEEHIVRSDVRLKLTVLHTPSYRHLYLVWISLSMARLPREKNFLVNDDFSIFILLIKLEAVSAFMLSPQTPL